MLSFFLISFFTYVNSKYTSVKDLPNLKEGFTHFDFGIDNATPLYLVDLNNDKYIDIIAACNTGTAHSLCYYVYDNENGKFIPYQSLPSISFEQFKITSCIANDLNQDSYIDLIITLQNSESTLITQIYLFNKDTKSFDMKYQIDNSVENVLVADLGDMRGINILFYQNETRKFLTFQPLTTEPQVYEFETLISTNRNLCNASNKHNRLQFNSPNSNGYVDIDGDCLNDLIIDSYDSTTKTRYLEIWKAVIENDKIKYCLTSDNVYTIDEKLGLFTIVDIDRNAMPDLVFPVLESSPPKILIAYNKLKLEYTWTDNFCDNHKPLKFTDSTGTSVSIESVFDNKISLETSNNNYISLVTIYNDNQVSFYNTQDIPTVLRFIDINQDSYPDFVTVLYNSASGAKTPYVFLSQEVLYDKQYTGESRRTFSKEHIYDFNQISKAANAFFFDFGDSGKMSLIMSDSNNKLTGLYNHNVYDTYSMKSFLLFDTNCFYCVEYGSSQRFITTNIDGTRRMDLSLQSPQPSMKNWLNEPFAYLGIGRSNNYIENFHIISGTEEKRADNDKVYTPVIPNSQLVIFHNRNKNSTTWKVDLVVKPTKNLGKLITVIVLLIALMTTVVVYLGLKEREEDSLENKETFAPWFG